MDSRDNVVNQFYLPMQPEAPNFLANTIRVGIAINAVLVQNFSTWLKFGGTS
jgi:hypothetical protein